MHEPLSSSTLIMIANLLVKLGIQKKTKKVKEKVIQSHILAYLRSMKISADIITLGMYSGKGVADIVGCLPDGRYLAIEVKCAGKKPTELQAIWLKEKVKAGAIAFVAHSVEEVEEYLKGFGY